MKDLGNLVLVFGATGQQGGSVAIALRGTGREVRALVRNPAADKVEPLRRLGVEIVQGDFTDVASVQSALHGVYGVFSVQPSSGQGEMYGVSDEDEIRYGTTIADLAVQSGVQHLVYSSTNAARGEPSGMGHFDSKARIEAYVRALPIDATIIRPAAFMEMLMMPAFGLPTGHLSFFMKPGQKMQFIAVEDIGKIVATIFANPARFRGKTMEIAGDAITGNRLAEYLTKVTGREITYARFTEELLAGNPFLLGLTRLVDDGRLAGNADLSEMRKLNPRLLSFESWLTGSGQRYLAEALGSNGEPR